MSEVDKGAAVLWLSRDLFYINLNLCVVKFLYE